jgi:hypothetical protein
MLLLSNLANELLSVIRTRPLASVAVSAIVTHLVTRLLANRHQRR